MGNGIALCMILRCAPDKSLLPMPVLAFLIEHPNGLVLYDTGSNPKAMEGYWPKTMQRKFALHQSFHQRLEQQLALVGVRPEEIQTIVLSHMHLDHTGGLPLFPDAEVYVPSVDYINALLAIHTSSDPEQHGGYIFGDLHGAPAKSTPCGRGFRASSRHRCSKPARAYARPSWACSARKAGRISASAGCGYVAQITNPPIPPRSPYDRQLYLASIQKLHRLQQRYGATIIFPHDIEQFQQLRTAPEFYE